MTEQSVTTPGSGLDRSRADVASAPRRRWTADPLCPLRPGETCTLCHPGATGPQDCSVVALVMDDPDLRAELALRRAAARRAVVRPGP